jgi:hypothetical protein
MKRLLKQGCTLLFLLVLIFGYFRQSVSASNYGEGKYSAGNYDVGEAAATNGNSASSNSDHSTTPSAPGCSDQAPGAKAPWLHSAIAQNGSSILLYFAAADEPTDHYALEFGTKSGEYPYGSTNIGGKGTGTYLVQSLQPDTTYYFRVRAGNGCATGSWSNELSAKTKKLVSFKQLTIEAFELQSVERPQPSEQDDQPQQVESEKKEKVQADNFIVNIKVTDKSQKPVKGAKVTIHSTVQERTTDEDGFARFENVESGDHNVLVAYDGFEGEQRINLTGDVKEFNLTITLEQKAILTSPLVLTIGGGMGCIILVLIVLLLRNRRTIFD